jgi:hypothetical protein
MHCRHVCFVFLLPDDTSVDPEIFNIGGSAMKSHATEGHSPHKKGTKKYKAHMAAMHANSVDLSAMRDALKLDESTDANTIVAEYTRACLDLSHNTWNKVCEQIDHVRSFVKEDVDIENVRVQLRKMHEREALDRNILIKENIDKLRQIVQDKSAMSIKFSDGSMKVDMTTASIFLQVFDKVKEETQAKIVDRIQTKQGFLSVLDKMYSMIGESMKLNEVYETLTEEQFDEKAGKKDACYHKVKSRYKVWPSAYASGALVQCRKKGAKNWGNSKKK